MRIFKESQKHVNLKFAVQIFNNPKSNVKDHHMFNQVNFLVYHPIIIKMYRFELIVNQA